VPTEGDRDQETHSEAICNSFATVMQQAKPICRVTKSHSMKRHTRRLRRSCPVVVRWDSAVGCKVQGLLPRLTGCQSNAWLYGAADLQYDADGTTHRKTQQLTMHTRDSPPGVNRNPSLSSLKLIQVSDVFQRHQRVPRKCIAMCVLPTSAEAGRSQRG
jgi:hypothetical protein